MTITVAVIIVTGVLGNILADFICKIFRITEPIAKGLAIRFSIPCHRKTAKAMEMGEIEGAMSSLSIAVGRHNHCCRGFYFCQFYIVYYISHYATKKRVPK